MEAPSPWYDRLGRAELVFACVMAAAMPLGEGLTLGAGGALCAVQIALAVIETRRGERPTRLDFGGRLMLAGFAGWVAVGAVSAVVQQHPVRGSSFNRELMFFAVFVGWRLATRWPLSRFEWPLLCFAGGLAVTTIAALSQMLFGTFPGEGALLRGPAESMGQLFVPDTKQRAFTGIMANRVRTAKVLLVALMLGCGVVATGARPVRARGLAIVAWSALALPLTWVRMAVIGAVGAAAALVALERLRPLRALVRCAVPLTVVATLTAVVVGGSTLVAGRWDYRVGGLTARRWIWQHALAMFGDHPWFGTGLGTYTRMSPDYFPPGEAPAHLLDAHCQHLTILVEVGLVGWLAWLVMWAGLGSALQRLWCAHEAPASVRGVRAAATLFLGSALLMSTTHDILFHAASAFAFWLVCGLVLGAAGRLTGPHPTSGVGSPFPRGRRCRPRDDGSGTAGFLQSLLKLN